MKTKKIEIKAWIDYEDEFHWDTFRQTSKPELKPTERAIPCTITFEVPIEEPKVEITESQFDQIFTPWLEKQVPDRSIYFGDLKRKLFGEENKTPSCCCPTMKNDVSPFDGVSYYCPIHGR